ncbi:MAG: glycosyltransferase family 4 protein [Spirochaetes bacterium]|jgi:glycosyltransferase involved in cell wall biosynthesis|nr:glycosyltransferase family 4 protein [Spirochaetota bacterium]
MKLLLVTHKFPPSVGGMENQCYELYRGLSSKYDVELYVMPEKESRIWFLFRLKSRLKKYLKKNPDITHVYFNDALIATAAAAVRSVSDAHTLATVHGLDIVYPARLYQKKIVANLNKNIDTIVAVSRATAEVCIERGVDQNRVVVVANGVDVSLKQTKKDNTFVLHSEKLALPDLSDKKILVSIGRGVRRKGFSWFLSSVVPRLSSDYFYIIVGPPQKKLLLFRFLFTVLPRSLSRLLELTGIAMDQVAIEALLRKPGIRDKAAYVGKIPFNDLVQLLKCSTAFIMPNIRVEGDAEGFGLVALEAVMNGTVAIVSELEGITEAIQDGKNGFYVTPENADDWVKKVETVSAKRFNREKFIASSIDYTEKNFSWDKMVDGYSRLLKDGTES